MNRFQFVADHQRRYGVKRLCTILDIARSSVYYRRRTAADRVAWQAADARLAARIRAVHHGSGGTYGVLRITAELRDDGERINHKRIARVMRSIGLAGVRLRLRHRTTITDPAAAKAPGPDRRDFTASEPNTKYVGDITYLLLEGGKFLYLATVIASVGVPNRVTAHIAQGMSEKSVAQPLECLLPQPLVEVSPLRCRRPVPRLPVQRDAAAVRSDREAYKQWNTPEGCINKLKVARPHATTRPPRCTSPGSTSPP
ncbi:IS3 family transposase, partial [Streptomyces parvus]|uniref:IS3 family transposase n=1 Tax=Streptomyces parvus TaxID=66428 RepID=UPI00381F77B0